MTDGAVAVDGSRPVGRSPRLMALLLAVLCTSACESSTVSGLNIRAAPTTFSRIVGQLGSAGAAVVVECYTRGQAIHGQTMWYRITSPRVGYVTAYYVRRDDGGSLTTIPHC